MFTIESDFDLSKFFKSNTISFNENFPPSESCTHEYVLHGHTPCSVIFEIGNIFDANYIAIDNGFSFKSKYTFESFMEDIDALLMSKIGMKSSAFKDNNWRSNFDFGSSAFDSVEDFLQVLRDSF